MRGGEVKLPITVFFCCPVKVRSKVRNVALFILFGGVSKRSGCGTEAGRALRRA